MRADDDLVFVLFDQGINETRELELGSTMCFDRIFIVRVNGDFIFPGGKKRVAVLFR